MLISQIILFVFCVHTLVWLIKIHLVCGLNYLQFVSDSSLSLDMYPHVPDSLRPPNSPAGKGAAAARGDGTPKGAKAKGNQGDIGEDPDLLESVISTRDVDAFVSVMKYINQTLKGFSPKNQVEIDEALIQLNAIEGTALT